jgi:STE24 endopeptidase
VTRLYLLLIFALWLVTAGSVAAGVDSPWGHWPAGRALTAFLGGYVLLVGAVAVAARHLARPVDAFALHRNTARFNRIVTVARVLVPAWFAFGLFGPPGWGHMVLGWMRPWTELAIAHSGPEPAMLALPALLVGTLPPLAAWVAMWWAQYPADNAMRMQGLLHQLEDDVPLHAPPSLRQQLAANLRLQVLFILLPVVLILAVRDLALIAVGLAGVRLGQITAFDDWVLLPSAVLVYIFAPEILRRVLQTRPLPDSPLRRRLEAICRAQKLRYRDILLWRTQHSMGNAAVMGLFPPMRYILLSDLLLESMTDQQIEAVFAHEVGHIVHRHMLWYVVFFAILVMFTAGPGAQLAQWMDRWAAARWSTGVAGGPRVLGVSYEHLRDLAALASLFGGVFVLFGYLSRRFERQADVFAARMVQSNWASAPEAPGGNGPAVGEFGAAVFAGALHRVATVNNIPVGARSWCHGSIARRMKYIRELAVDPARTAAFDRFMSRLYATMVVVLVICGALAALA